MGRLSRSLTAFALLTAAAAGLAACGGGENADLLPGATASQIESELDRVEQLVVEGECAEAAASAAEIGSQVEGLEGVDERLQRALAEGAARLTENVATECEEAPEEEIAPVEEPEETEPEEKPEKPEKPDKEEKEAEKEESDDEGPTLPPQSNGKGEEKGQGEEPPVEPEEPEGPPSGGVGPGTAVEGGSD